MLNRIQVQRALKSIIGSKQTQKKKNYNQNLVILTWLETFLYLNIYERFEACILTFKQSTLQEES